MPAKKYVAFGSTTITVPPKMVGKDSKNKPRIWDTITPVRHQLSYHNKKTAINLTTNSKSNTKIQKVPKTTSYMSYETNEPRQPRQPRVIQQQQILPVAAAPTPASPIPTLTEEQAKSRLTALFNRKGDRRVYTETIEQIRPLNRMVAIAQRNSIQNIYQTVKANEEQKQAKAQLEAVLKRNRVQRIYERKKAAKYENQKIKKSFNVLTDAIKTKKARQELENLRQEKNIYNNLESDIIPLNIPQVNIFGIDTKYETNVMKGIKAYDTLEAVLKRNRVQRIYERKKAVKYENQRIKKAFNILTGAAKIINAKKVANELRKQKEVVIPVVEPVLETIEEKEKKALEKNHEIQMKKIEKLDKKMNKEDRPKEPISFPDETSKKWYIDNWRDEAEINRQEGLKIANKVTELQLKPYSFRNQEKIYQMTQDAYVYALTYVRLTKKATRGEKIKVEQ